MGTKDDIKAIVTLMVLALTGMSAVKAAGIGLSGMSWLFLWSPLLIVAAIGAMIVVAAAIVGES